MFGENGAKESATAWYNREFIHFAKPVWCSASETGGVVSLA